MLIVTATAWSPSHAAEYPQYVAPPSPQLQEAHLEPGSAIERKLAGGENHSYRLILASGQFLLVSVEQKGVDVAVRLFAPGGVKLVEVDSPNGAWGNEPVSFVAESNGEYRVEVSQLEPDATAGSYRILVEELRAASHRDRDLSAAQRTYALGDELRNKATAESLKNAFSRYEDALKLFRSIGDRRGQAGSLFYMGNVRQIFGENQQAIEFYNQALPLWQAVNEPTAAAVTLNNIGIAYNDSGEKAKAFKPLFRALATYRTVGDKLQEATTLNNIGRVYEESGEYQKALEHYTQVLPLFQATKRLRETAYTLVNTGVIHERLGEYEKAIEYNDQALPLLRKLGDRRGEGSALVTLANIYFGLGSYQKALEVYNQAMPILRATGSRQAITQVLISTGKCYVMLGDKEKALDHLNQALEASRSLKDRFREAYTLNNIGLLLAESGNKPKAQDSYIQALELMRKVADLHGEALTLNNIGRLYASSGERAKALDSMRQALAINRALGERSDEGNTLANLMFTWKKFQRPSLAIFYGKQAVNAFQEIRTRVQKLEKELQASYLNSKESVYRELAGLLISQGRLPEAQQVLRFLKEEEYFEFVRRDSNDPGSLYKRATLTPGEAEWERRYYAIADQIAAIGRERGELLAKPKRTAEEDKRLVDLEHKLEVSNQHFQIFLDQLTKEFVDTNDSKYRVTSLRDTQALQSDLRELGRRTAALFTVVGEEKYRIILVTPDVQLAREYPIKAAELNQKVLEFREAVQDPATDPRPLAQELYKIVVGPIARDLRHLNSDTLMWSLDGVLRYLPISALHDGEGYMVERYRNVVFTLASSSRLKDIPHSRLRGLGLGVSKASGDFPALPGVPLELEAIIRDNRRDSARKGKLRGLLPGKMMLDEAFTLESMRTELRRRYPLVHIASHFQFKPGNESDSFLLLGNDQHLTLAQVKRAVTLFDGVDLLTLSACDTATGSAGADGKEVEGFAVMAQRQGAKAVMAGLWPVADNSTRLLMQNFYQLRISNPQLPKTEALRQAQLALLGRKGAAASGRRRDLRLQTEKEGQTVNYAHPFFWAPFILIGNWK